MPYLHRDVVAVLKLEGPNYDGPLSPQKMGGPSILLLNKIPKKWGGLGPPGPLGDYIPAFHVVNLEMDILSYGQT